MKLVITTLPYGRILDFPFRLNTGIDIRNNKKSSGFGVC